MKRQNATAWRSAQLRRFGIRSRWLVFPLTAVLAATLAGQQVVSAAPKEWTPPKPKDVAGVPVVNVKPELAAAGRSAGGAAAQSRKVAWPAPASADVDLATAVGPRASAVGRSGGVKAGALPVRVGRPDAAAGAPQAKALAAAAAPSRVRVTMHDRAAADRVGVSGVLLEVARTDGRAATGAVSVAVDYSGFAHAYGGDWASRLRLVELPACALTRPSDRACTTGVPLGSVNDESTGTVTANAPVRAAGASVLSVEAGASGDNGDYTATDLSSAGSWEISKQTGDFSWSLPMRMPPSLGGPSPSITLAYSSGSVDGRTGATNNQGGWIGDGWQSWPGFIERKYIACADDKPTNDKRKTGDQCWFNDNATLSLNGRAGDLIRDGDVWRLKNDDGTRVEQLRAAARDNGDNDDEYWKVTTPDGIEYYFGYHKLPGWSADDPTTNSTWTVPVFGDDKTDECHDDDFTKAHCKQAWRWNLDYIVDPKGNTLAYFYGKEQGAYARNSDPNKRTTYDRGGYLKRAEYGMRRGAEYSQAAPLRVLFGTDERCLSDCWEGKAWESKPKKAEWPDTPWDQFCAEDTKCKEQGSPTYWSARRLTKVTTQKRSGPAAYTDIESWTLRHSFDSPGSGENTPMWLAGVTHAGHIGGTVKDPEIVFGHGAESLDNRVDAPNDSRTGLKRWRIKRIETESGGDILVTYSGAGCTRDKLPDPKTNKTRCMPAYYAWPGTGEPTIDWFHKYVVTRIDQDDTVTDQLTETTFYDYLDDPAWHYQDDEITKDKHKTWGEWRGYGRVRVRHGSADGAQSAVEYRYLRGMNGDKGKDGTASVTDWGGTVVDHEALNGFLRQEITYDGANNNGVGRELFSTVHEPWKRGPTATRTRSGVTTNAYMTQTGSSRTRTALPNSKWRITGTATDYNNDGLPTAADDFGDEAVTGDETCTRTTYARNPARDNDDIFMVDKVAQTETLSRVCDGAPATAAPGTVLSRTRTFYDRYTDNSSFGDPPTKGNVVRVEELDSWNGATPKYVRTESSAYDGNGRVTAATDARGHTTTTDYTTAHGGLVTKTVVGNPLKHTITTVKEPAWDLPTRITDANSAVTELAYDGLGRLTSVWLPGRGTDQRPNMRFGYELRDAGGPTAVTTETLLTNGIDYKKSVNLYDGFLRKRQSQTQATGGGRLLTDTFYNTAGQIDWESEAYYDVTNAPPSTDLGRPQGQIPGLTQTLYDGAGRETAKIFKALGVEKWRTTTIHEGDRQTIIPPLGGTATTALIDAQERTTVLRQYKKREDAGKDDDKLFDATRYTYDLQGNLKKIVDPTGNTWSYTYDLRGRQRTAADPDKGSTKTFYDAADNIETVEDAQRKVIAYTYDPLGRKTSIRDGSPTGPKRAEWIYDTLANGVGKLTKSIRYAAGAAYESRIDAYDEAGRPEKTSVVLPSNAGGLCAGEAAAPCVYTTAVAYKQNGSPATTTVPKAAQLAAEKLTYGYNDIGEQTSLISPIQIYVGTAGYNKLGQLTQRQLGNTGSRVAVTSDYDEPTRRLTATNVVPELKPEAANYSYEYDHIGNITRIADAPQGQKADTQCFTFDYLRRLTAAWTPRSDDCKAAPDVNALDGPAPYWHAWEYDRTGNRAKEFRHGGAGTTTFTYAYPPSGEKSVRPHAVTSVEMTAPGQTFSRGFTYDDSGNMRTRLSDASNQQTLNWDAEGRLESVTEAGKSTSFVYDADGTRLIRKDAVGTTLYLPGGTEVTLATGAATAKATRYYSHKDTVIASRSDAGLFWIVGDHHGTAQLTVNASNLAVSKRRTLPFGDTRGAAPTTWPSSMDKGFVGGTKDRTGLTHLGARLYDPAIGRFVSVDPVIDPKDPQQLNAYAYSNNNPVTMSDPNGEFFGALKKAASAVASAATTVANTATKVVTNTVEAIKEDPLKFAVGVAVGVAAAVAVGALCATGVGCLIVAGAVAGAAAAGAEYGVDVAQGEREFSAGDLAKEMAIGGAIGGVTAGAGVGASKVASGARRAFGSGAKKTDDLARDAAAAGRRTDDASGGSCPVPWMSFDPRTPVLLANGATKPIGKVRLGDKVVASDPIRGITRAEPVVALYSSRDVLLADVTIVRRDGRTATIHTTQNHPFWNATKRRWTHAADLEAGDQLRTAGGSRVTVAAVSTFVGSKRMLNLGVDKLRTYYVIAGGAPVLVHNRPFDDVGSVNNNVGTYGRLAPSGTGKERHHIPPHSTRPAGRSYSSGPAIRMDRPDHRALYSTGSSLESQAWRQWQSELIAAGRADEAMEMEYADIQRRFPGKYDAEIAAHRERFATGGSCP